LAWIPLPLVGMVAYGLLAALSLQENGEELLPGFDDLTLLWMATSLPIASACYIFILNTKFVGTSCLYNAYHNIHLLHTNSYQGKRVFFLKHERSVGQLANPTTLCSKVFLQDIGLASSVFCNCHCCLALTNSYTLATTLLKE
jgi:hypothetical protein